MVYLTITEKINAFLEIQGFDLTTAFDHCSLSNFLFECRDHIEQLEETNAILMQNLQQEYERSRHYKTALSNISKMTMCMATSYNDLAQKQKDLAIDALAGDK